MKWVFSGTLFDENKRLPFLTNIISRLIYPSSFVPAFLTFQLLPGSPV
jgi:hypothetical protein